MKSKFIAITVAGVFSFLGSGFLGAVAQASPKFDHDGYRQFHPAAQLSRGGYRHHGHGGGHGHGHGHRPGHGQTMQNGHVGHHPAHWGGRGR